MSKGSQWERDIAKYLTKWLTGQDEEYYFWRSPGSGSIGTVSCTNPDLHGDIIPLKDEANILCSRFVIECKTGYKEASLDKHLKYNKSDPIKSFWEQVTEDSQKTWKLPMLVYRKKGMSTPWIGVTRETFKKLNKYITPYRHVYLYWGPDLPDLYFYEKKQFFDKITPEIIKKEWHID